MSTGIIRVGVSSWTFGPWRGVFYPKDLKRERELEYAAARFRTLEVNSTFYGPLRPEMFQGWAEQVPAEFVFSVKAPRLITHVLRLADINVAMANFLASGLLCLGLHLGPILWQLPANLRFDPRRVDAFLRLLPRSTEGAAALARQHDKSSLRGRACLTPDAQRPIRHAVEVSHPSFRCAAFVDMLRAHDVAMVQTDATVDGGMMDVTADFVYCRLNGPAGKGLPPYDLKALEGWIKRARTWAAGEEPEDARRIGGKGRRRRRDVFVVFGNRAELRAPAHAQEMIRRLRT